MLKELDDEIIEDGNSEDGSDGFPWIKSVVPLPWIKSVADILSIHFSIL